ncbi:MAG: WXG100 family type VII secretion target [Sciscionella sp.]
MSLTCVLNALIERRWTILPGFDVEPWEIASAAGVVRDAGEELQLGLDRLGLEVHTLLDGWSGRAGASFADGWQEWRAGAVDVLRALDSMAQLLDATGRGYAAAESANMDAAR